VRGTLAGGVSGGGKLATATRVSLFVLRANNIFVGCPGKERTSMCQDSFSY
jgi:hypothetical protein